MKKNGSRKMVSYNGENVGGIGYLLGTTRVSLGLSRLQVARVAGISVPMLKQVEYGTRPLPAKHVQRLCEVLGLNRTLVAGLSLQRTHSFRKLKKVS